MPIIQQRKNIELRNCCDAYKLIIRYLIVAQRTKQIYSINYGA